MISSDFSAARVWVRSLRTNLWRTTALACILLWQPTANGQQPTPAEPTPIIFDTDIGNDVDDVLALGMIHALQSRGECKLVAVTITKDHPQCALFVDAVNTFYGRGDIPIGVVKKGVTPEQSKFTILAERRDNGVLRYPRSLTASEPQPSAVKILRQALERSADRSVDVVQVGFSTNLARLLQSKPDAISPLSGLDLVRKKVRLLSIMAGAFEPIAGKVHLEYNVVKDIGAAQTLARNWPSPIVYSGFEIGLSVPYPAVSILNDYKYTRHHPLAESYHLYQPPPHNRPTWDLTSVLYAVYPHRNYFSLSPAGQVTVNDKGATTFAKTGNGKHRYLVLGPRQRSRVVEALVQLSSQPPTGHIGERPSN